MKNRLRGVAMCLAGISVCLVGAHLYLYWINQRAHHLARPVRLFLDALVDGRDPEPFMYGPSRPTLDLEHFEGILGYKRVEMYSNVVVVDVQFEDRVERFEVRKLHGLVGRVDAGENRK